MSHARQTYAKQCYNRWCFSYSACDVNARNHANCLLYENDKSSWMRWTRTRYVSVREITIVQTIIWMVAWYWVKATLKITFERTLATACPTRRRHTKTAHELLATYSWFDRNPRICDIYVSRMTFLTMPIINQHLTDKI